MLKNIKINMEILEQMIYFWASVKEKQRVDEKFLDGITSRPEMKYFYHGEYTDIEARKALSAITNREPLNSYVKETRKMWNNNMWMLEDDEMMKSMISPIKVLNLNSLIEKVNAKNPNYKHETVNIFILPGTFETEKIDGNNLYFNFFKIFPDWEGNLSVEGKQVEEYFEDAILRMS